MEWLLDGGQKGLGIFPDPATPGLSPAESLAIATRNAASMTGRCACGAVASGKPSRGQEAFPAINHEHDCPAASPIIEAAIRRLQTRES